MQGVPPILSILVGHPVVYTSIWHRYINSKVNIKITGISLKELNILYLRHYNLQIVSFQFYGNNLISNKLIKNVLLAMIN